MIEEITSNEESFGVRLMNLVHTRSCQSETVFIKQILEKLHQLFIKKLSNWILYANAKDVNQEFLIVTKVNIKFDDRIQNSQNHNGTYFFSQFRDQYEIDPSQIPYFMDEKDVGHVLFIGKATSILKGLSNKEQTRAFQDLLSIFSPKLSACYKESKFNSRLLLQTLFDFRAQIGTVLFDAVIVNNQIAGHFQAFRYIYLAGHGNFVDEFLEEEAKLKAKMDNALAPVNSNGTSIFHLDLNQIMKRTLKSVAENEPWYDLARSCFRMRDAITNPNTNAKMLFKGTAVYFHYQIQWPLDLFVTPEHIERFDSYIDWQL